TGAPVGLRRLPPVGSRPLRLAFADTELDTPIWRFNHFPCWRLRVRIYELTCRGIDVREAALGRGGRGQRVEPVGDETTVRGLHRAHRYEAHPRADALDEAIERDCLHADSAIGVRQEREEH